MIKAHSSLSSVIIGLSPPRPLTPEPDYEAHAEYSFNRSPNIRADVNIKAWDKHELAPSAYQRGTFSSSTVSNTNTSTVAK
jgi:hypothetical protein